MMRLAAVAMAAAATTAQAKTYFQEKFETEAWEKAWTPSTWKGDDQGKFEWTAGDWFVDEAAEKGIMTSEDMRWHSISAPIGADVSTKDKTLVVSFSVKHSKKEYAFCGGGYIKLLPKTLDQKAFGGDSEYYVMFGPDLCGYDVSRIHLIFNHKGENLLKEEDIKLDYDEKNEFTHLYTLILEADGTYQVLLDNKEKAAGKLSEEWAFPSEKIKDPAQSKPDDWVDTKKIADPAEVKPEGYDDIAKEIPDPEAEKPEDWDDEDDGEWEAPTIDNPEYKGPWTPTMIDNPEYKGEWEHPMIPNPDYAPDTYAKYETLGYVGFELWTVNAGSVFDNVLVTDDKEYAKKAAAETFDKIVLGEKEAKEEWDKLNKPEETPMDDMGGEDTDEYGGEEDIEEPHDEL